MAAILLTFGLAGCAGSVAPPTVVTAMPAGERAALHLAAVRTEAAPGVAISDPDLTRITQLVGTDIQAVAPGLIDSTAAGARSMRIVITRYDAGSAGARFMLAGLGQIRLDADVTITEPPSPTAPSGRVIAEWKVAKQFSFGGLYGALTTMEDVEKGFSKSVADLVKPAR